MQGVFNAGQEMTETAIYMLLHGSVQLERDNGTIELVHQAGAVVGPGGRVLERSLGKEDPAAIRRIVAQERSVVQLHVTALGLMRSVAAVVPR